MKQPVGEGTFKQFTIWDKPITFDSLAYLAPKNIPNNWDTIKFGSSINFWYIIYFGSGHLNPKDFKNKKFWVISFDNYEITIGGGLSIFIDADNGEILYSALRK